MAAVLRLLMVEDSEDDAELIRIELEKGGYELAWTRVDTEEDFVAALNQTWDLVICDFQMPRFNGLRAFELYKSRGLDMPFLFVSGVLGEERAVEAMRAGARDYMLKGDLGRLSVAVQREMAEFANRQAQCRAEESTRREQRRLAMAVQASGAGVFEFRVPQGEDTYLSDRWAGILGYLVDELPSHEKVLDWFFQQVHTDDLPVVQQAYEQFVAGRSHRYGVECRMHHKDGRWVEVSIQAEAVERENGQATHVVGVMLDLTDRRKLEAELRQAQKMEAVGRLAGGVAHDFNNILTAIQGFGSYVLDALREGDPAREDMQELLNCAARAESLTAQLLAFSRRHPTSPRVLNVNTLIRDLERMLRRIVGEDVNLETFLPPDIGNVHVDPGSLEQVVVNIAVNARDAMPAGGTLTLETENVELGSDYGFDHGAVISPGDYIAISISDDGIGMDETTQRQIFEPFFTTKGPGRGTGLGLSTCYGIVKQAGGHIWVYSEPGSGTTFKVYLPRVRQATDDVPMTVPPASLRGSETILVAEDDEAVRRLVVRAFSGLGYDVIEASSGYEALSKCEELTRPIDLLVTDVVMPEMNGKQLAQSMRTVYARMKVLYTSGYTPNALVHRGVLEPGTRMVHKPFTRTGLVQIAREVLDE